MPVLHDRIILAVHFGVSELIEDFGITRRVMQPFVRPVVGNVNLIYVNRAL